MKYTLILLALFSTDIMANLKAPIDLPSASLMPHKIRNLSLKQVFVSVSEKYNNNGENVLVSDPLFTDVSFGSIAITKRDAAERSAIDQILDSLGEDKETVIAQTTGQVNIKANATVPVIAYGVTKKWTLAVAVPVLKYSTNVGSSVKHINTELIKKVTKQLDNKGATNKSAEALSKLERDPVGAKLEEYGYEPLLNEEGTKLGDIKVVSKLQVARSKKNLITLQTELTLPTGKEADINKAVDVPGGDGQTDVGFFILNDHFITSRLIFSGKIGFTAQLADTTVKRIPEISTSTLTPDKDLNTKRNLGDKSSLELGLKYKYNGFGVSGGYGFQYKSADKYEGTLYEEQRYKWISKDTVQNMHSVQLKLSYDTISLFRQKKFAAPLMVDVNHTRVVAGKNVVNDPLTSLNFSLFF